MGKVATMTPKYTRAQVEEMRKQPRRALVTIEPTRAAVGDGVNRITIAANAEARDMFVLDLASLRIDNYLRNPVVHWGHDTRDLPIGRSTKVGRTEAGGFEAEFEFLEGDEFAERVKNAWDKGFIRAASVSWGGGDWTFQDDGKIRETNAELFEWSLVSVPADPDALRLAERTLGVPEGTLTPNDEARSEEQRLAEMVEGLLGRVDDLANEVAALRAEASAEPVDDGDEGGGDDATDDGEGDEEERAISAALADLAAMVRAKE